MTPCEILLINDKDFNRLLYNYTTIDFYKRLDVIKACGIFNSWNKVDLIRLARMGQLKTYPNKTIILKQKEKSNYLYILVKGLVKAYKQPSKIEIIERKLMEAKLKAERFDTKYNYHHKVNKLNSISTNEIIVDNTTSNQTIKSSNSVNNNIDSNKDKDDDKDDSTIATPNNHNTIMINRRNSINFNALIPIKKVPLIHIPKETFLNAILAKPVMTISEEERYLLELEIQKLQQQLIKLQNDSSNHIDLSYNDVDDIINNKNICEITTLKWPMIFGETCILEPDTGVSRGSMITATTCEVFLIHKTQMQTFRIQDILLEQLKLRSTHYPNDIEIVESMKRNDLWRVYRENMMKNFPKDRWPSSENEYDPFL